MNANRRVVITGLGVLTPIGSDVDTFWRNLQNGVSGIDCITAFDTSAYGKDLKALFIDAAVDGLHRHGLGVIFNKIRFNQVQALGTHNSYHMYPPPPLDSVQALQYYEDPLDVQLQSQGVRQFELDVNVNKAPAGTFSVVHIQGIDENTTCKAFVDCLNTIKAWSDAHPQHAPIGVQLETGAVPGPLPSRAEIGKEAIVTPAPTDDGFATGATLEPPGGARPRREPALQGLEC